MKTKTVGIVLVLVALFSASLTGLALAQQAPNTSTINLAYVSVQLSYPSQVKPGDSVTVHVLASSHDNFEMDKLVVQIFVPVQNDLKQVASATITQGIMMTTGSQVMKDVQFTVPSDAPSTSLVAVVSEKVRYLGYMYEYVPYTGMFYAPQNSTPPSSYYGYYQNTITPSYLTATDDKVATLSYVKAPDADYANLQSQYQAVSQQLAQAQSENQKLQQDLKAQQSQNAQLQSQAGGTAQQLGSAQSMIPLLEGGILALAVLAGALAFLLYRKGSTKTTGPSTIRQSSPENIQRQSEAPAL